ncbi:MAG: DnaD domain protein [Bacilli bacterium]|nr:DnaD domain protein [Bacilli bacterium]
MMDKVINLLKDGNIVIPKLLFLNYKKLNINEIDLIILIYLLNDKEVYNPKKISVDLNIGFEEVLISIDNLSNKGILKIDLKKINNIREEHVNLDDLYTKLGYLIINEEQEKIKTNNIYDVFEREFGRTLSPIEYQIINGWLSDKISEELIIEALKEATYNGVSNLRYIDKILYEWRKKGINNIQSVEKSRMEFNHKKEEKKEMFDYNWLDDNDE